jgi:hypothetical protein
LLEYQIALPHYYCYIPLEFASYCILVVLSPEHVEMQQCLGAARNKKRRGLVMAIKDLEMAACYWFLLQREK